MKQFIEFCKHQHDVVCNQKYDNGKIPYSMHLEYVAGQVDMFASNEVIDFIRPWAKQYYISDNYTIKQLLIKGAYGHDLIEDARVTYNDIKNIEGEALAEIIFACTETRGRNRAERHGAEYFATLKANPASVFVKLCDIIANVKYGMLAGSSMTGKYKKEFQHLKEELADYAVPYKELFDCLEHLFKLVK